MKNTNAYDAQIIFDILVKTANILGHSKYGGSFVIKGGSALMCKLISAGAIEYIRKTSDLDIHCASREVWKTFLIEVEYILNNNPYGLIYKVEKIRTGLQNNENSDSIVMYVISEGNKYKIKFDMNIKSNSIIGVERISMLSFNAYDNITMLTDKIVVIESEKIYRRIKDLYDLTVLLLLQQYRSDDILYRLNIKHPDTKLKNMFSPDNILQMKHAYDKYDAINKDVVRFEELVGVAQSFLPVIELRRGGLVWNNHNMIWLG